MQPWQLAPKAIAAAFLAGPADEQSASTRISRVINASPRAIATLARCLLKHFPSQTRPRLLHVVRFIRDDAGFQRFSKQDSFSVDSSIRWSREMRPAMGAPSTWPVLPIP